MKDIGIVIPSYNEEASIADLIVEIRRYVPESIIVVVDDSPGVAVAHAMAQLLNHKTELIRRGSKGGRGSAILVGLKRLLETDTEFFIEMDCDFSHPPKQIPELAKKLKNEQLDMVVASRYLPGSQILNWPVRRRVFSRYSNFLARRALGIAISDYTNGFRCYSRSAAKLIIAECGRFGSGFIGLSEILVNLSCRCYKIGEMPTVFTDRLRGQSSLRFFEVASSLQWLFKLRGLKHRLLKDCSGEVAKAPD